MRDEKKRSLARDDFVRLLRHSRSIRADSSWEDVKQELESEPSFKAVSALHCRAADCALTSASLGVSVLRKKRYALQRPVKLRGSWSLTPPPRQWALCTAVQ